MRLVTDMSNLPLDPNAPVTIEDDWGKLPEQQQMIATDRATVVREVLNIMHAGTKQRPAIELFILRLEDEAADAYLLDVAKRLGRGGQLPSYSTINRWVNAQAKSGLVGLATAYKGSVRKAYDWEVRLLYLYSRPSKPSISATARKLQREGFSDVTESSVRRFVKSLPSNLSEMSKGRLGPRLFENTQKTFNRRSTENLPVGACYQGDGHTLDVYLQHPTGNKVWRAELTLWIDVSSRYVVGWYLSEAESAHSTLFALSYAILSHDHIPAILHIDNGSGYKNKMLGDESVGFYARLGIDVMHSLPYNAKGKGQVERFFGTMERDFNKWYPSYCGADMADEALQLLLKKHKKGEATLPTHEQWMADFNNWLVDYHNTKHSGLNGKTPAELWATLDKHSVEMKSTAIFWPRVERTVKRQAIRLDGREYMAPDLIQYNNKKLTVEYNLHDDRAVRVLDSKGRWICDAALVQKKDYLPASRIKEATQKRLKSSIKRLEVHAQEKRDRAGLSITHDQVLDDIELLTEQCSMPVEQKKGTEVPFSSVIDDQANNKISIDPYDTDY